jgi:hypothetical protein
LRFWGWQAGVVALVAVVVEAADVATVVVGDGVMVDVLVGGGGLAATFGSEHAASARAATGNSDSARRVFRTVPPVCHGDRYAGDGCGGGGVVRRHAWIAP